MNWDYVRTESEKTSYEVKPGKYRCVIMSVEESVSKSSGRPMLDIVLRPSGTKANVHAYLVQNEYFMKNLTSFYDSFKDIPEGDNNILTWVGAEGAAEFGAEQGSNGKTYLKHKWFISREKAADLPPFEGEKPERQEMTAIFTEDSDEDGIPF